MSDLYIDSDVFELDDSVAAPAAAGPDKTRITINANRPSFDTSMFEMDESAGGGDTVDQMNNWAAGILDPIKPFAAGAARGTAGLIGTVMDIANISKTGIDRLRGQPTAGDQLNQWVLGQVGGPDEEHPYLSAAGEFLPGIAVPGGGIASRGLSAAGAALGLGAARENKAGPVVEMLATLGGGLAPSGIQAIARRAAPALRETGNALRRKAIGTRQADYAKTAKDLGTYDIGDDQIESFTKTALDDLLSNGKIGQTANPKKALSAALKESGDLSKKVGKLVDDYDDLVGSPVYPQLDNAMEYISNGRVPANEADRYLKELSSLEQAIQKEGQGSLRYLQNQKVTWGKRYEEGNDIRNGFYQAVYHDLKKAIEGAVPDVEPLNRELSKYQIAVPILKRSLSGDENKDPVGGLVQALRTSGGTLTTPFIAGAAAGGSVGGPIGAMLGGTLTAAASPAGKYALGNAALRASGSAAGPSSAVRNAAVAGSIFDSDQPDSIYSTQPDLSQSDRSKTQPSYRAEDRPKAETQRLREKSKTSTNSTPNPLRTKAKTEAEMPIPAVKGEVRKLLTDAVIKVESGGKKDAISNKGAVGLMQVTPIAMREVMRARGVDDSVYSSADLRKMALKDGVSEDYGNAYLDLMLKQFKDPYLALAAYNAGPTLINKLLKKAPEKSFQAIAAKLPQETRDYVPKVERALMRLAKA